MPENIRSGQGSEMPNQEGIKSPNFQEANLLEPMPFLTDSHVEIEVNVVIRIRLKGAYLLSCLMRN